MAHKVEEQNNWEVLKDNQGTYVRIPKEHKGLLQLEDELGSSYLALLPIGETPENMRNCDLFQFAQDLSFSRIANENSLSTLERTGRYWFKTELAIGTVQNRA